MASQNLVLVLLVMGLTCLSQNKQPIPAPDDVSLTLRTQSRRQQFYLGEPIAVEYSYTAIPGRYLYVSRLDRLTVGRPLRVECSPAVESTSDESAASSAEASRFQEMLTDPDCGAGFGGGVGGGCSDCDEEIPLGASPLSFGFRPLNGYVRFRRPGDYSCRVMAAQVTTEPRDEKIRPALLVKSNPVEINITDNPAWAHSAALAYAAAYDKNCRGEDVLNQNFAECSAVATGLTYLDTAESMAIEIQFFDGRNQGWDNGFLDALANTSQRGEALQMMTRRIQDPDVQVSDFILQWLARWTMKADNPDAFELSANPSDYYAQATEQLRKYVRLLGSSLVNKNSSVLKGSVKSYEMLAGNRSCKGDPLVPDVERVAVLDAVKSRTPPRH